MEKTLVFCTSYFETEQEYFLRYKKWISYYQSIPFSEGKDFFLFDDGSDLSTADNLYNYLEGNISEDTKIEKVNFYHFPDRRGSYRTANHPGWYRSFFFSLDLAKKLGYTKIVHIESDLYLLSPKICEYIDDSNSGWISFTCPTYHFPESSLQIINKDYYEKFEEFRQDILSKGLDSMATKNIEWLLPLSHTEVEFVGDRYGERLDKQNKDMDYYAQTNLHQNLVFDYKRDLPMGVAKIPIINEQ